MSRYPYGRLVFLLPLKSLNHNRKKKREENNREKERVSSLTFVLERRLKFKVYEVPIDFRSYMCLL